MNSKAHLVLVLLTSLGVGARLYAAPAMEKDLSTGPILRVYRLAVATTGEWTALNGGAVASAMAAVVSTINQVNLYFEREFAIRFELVANNDLLIYTDPATDPYTKFEGQDYPTLMNQNQTVIDSTIGAANYDLGHLFFVGNYAVGAGRPC